MAAKVLLIYASIGTPAEANRYLSIDADRFTTMLSAAEASGESKAQVRINSGGGSWMEATSIFALIKGSSLKIDTYNDGLAASSASFLLQAGAKRYMVSHGRLMIHNCSSPAQGQVADLEKAIEGQRNLNESMAIIYAERTGQPIEKIREMMAAETWLSAEQALQLGFIDVILPANGTKVTAAPPAELATASANLDELQAFYASFLVPNTQPMKTLLLAALATAGITSVTAEATDEQVAEAVQNALGRTAQLEVDLEEATAKVTTAEQGQATAEQALETYKKQVATEAATAAATSLVDGAIASGRIVASQRPHFLELANANLASATAAINSLPAKASLTDLTSQNITGATAGSLTAGSVMAEIQQRNQPKKG